MRLTSHPTFKSVCTLYLTYLHLTYSYAIPFTSSLFRAEKGCVLVLCVCARALSGWQSVNSAGLFSFDALLWQPYSSQSKKRVDSDTYVLLLHYMYVRITSTTNVKVCDMGCTCIHWTTSIPTSASAVQNTLNYRKWDILYFTISHFYGYNSDATYSR